MANVDVQELISYAVLFLSSDWILLNNSFSKKRPKNFAIV
jgi:hypothetical protein